MIGLIYRMADVLRRRSFRHDHGRIGEDLAHRHLRRRGLTIVARNYRPRSGGGEIDLVAWHRGALVFVEVKTRETEQFGLPSEAVQKDKQRNLSKAALDYLRRLGNPRIHFRFDIVEVVLPKGARRPDDVRVIENAFDLSEPFIY